MGFITESMLNNILLNLHTSYLASVISTNGKTAKIQPLGLTKAYGASAQKQSPLSNVPIDLSARHKITGTKEIEFVTSVTVNKNVTKEKKTIDGEEIELVTDISVNVETNKKKETIPIIEPIKAGDIVVCVCGERDITEARNGKNAVPALGHHSMSDSIIVGVL